MNRKEGSKSCLNCLNSYHKNTMSCPSLKCKKRTFGSNFKFNESDIPREYINIGFYCEDYKGE